MTYRVRRVTTTRAGGVSKPPFATFNLGDHVGDDPKAVAANRDRLAATLGLGDGIVWMNQVHSAHVAVVDRGGATLDATDGLVTTTPGLALAVVTADCVPVLMADCTAAAFAVAFVVTSASADNLTKSSTLLWNSVRNGSTELS
ncbi:polyphenol oxidase family protein, partial [Mycobacterium sp. NAZ190054]|uniref:polyphenol oxidase family protein n=1 Tax=Mycobacterium sp. NAZ190054 TaxID=1747766 RepID=UPI0018D25365